MKRTKIAQRLEAVLEDVRFSSRFPSDDYRVASQQFRALLAVARAADTLFRANSTGDRWDLSSEIWRPRVEDLAERLARLDRVSRG